METYMTAPPSRLVKLPLFHLEVRNKDTAISDKRLSKD